jgi:hypothetical protein
MTYSAPPRSDFALTSDAIAVNSQLDDVLPGWRDSFGRDLPDDVDLRPAIARMRALLLMLEVRAVTGDLALAELTPAQTVSKTCGWIRTQLYGPEALGGALR